MSELDLVRDLPSLVGTSELLSEFLPFDLHHFNNTDRYWLARSFAREFFELVSRAFQDWGNWVPISKLVSSAQP